MNIRDILAKIGFQVEHEKLTKVEEQLEGIKRRLEFLAAAEVAKGLYELTEKFAHMAEDLHIASQAAGLTVEQLQKLSFAGEQAGVKQEELSMRFTRLSRSLYDAKNGSAEAVRAFALLGISGDQISGIKNAQDALYVVADRFKHMHDPIQKTAIATELLGRGSISMIGFLSQGSAALKAQGDEAERLGAVLNAGQVEALVDLEHTFSKLFALLKAIAGTIAAQVAPVFEYWVNDFIKFFQANRDLMQLNIEEWLETLAYTFGFLWEALKFGIGLLTSFSKAFGFEGHVLTVIGAIAGLIATLMALAKVIPIVTAVITSPFLPIIAAISGVILVVHELYALLSGKPTWLGTFYDWARSLGFVQKALAAVGSAWDSFKHGISLGGSWDALKGIAGFGAQNPTSPLASSTASFASALPSLAGGSSTGPAGIGSISVAAPVTVNVPAGTNPQDVHRAVREGIGDHLDRVSRQVQRSTQGAYAY